MNKINILLISLFFVLLGVLGFELYYFYSPTKKTAVVPTVIPTPSKAVNYTEAARDITGTVGDFFKEGAAGTLADLSISMTYEGTLSKIDPTEKTLTSFRTKLPLKVGLTVDFVTKDNHRKEMYFMQPELKKISFFSLDKSGKKTAVKSTDFKPGDKIIFTQTLDLLKQPSDNLIEATITKTN